MPKEIHPKEFKFFSKLDGDDPRFRGFKEAIYIT
jgi:hypothetical protein